MTVISKPNTFSPNTTASSADVNANFDTIYNDYNGGISAANLAANAVTTAKIADQNVTTAKIADANITVGKLAATAGGGSAGTGAWDSWTPTLANLTLGNGTVVARYMQIGKVVHFTFQFTLGSTSAVSTAPTFSVPVTASTTGITVGAFKNIIGTGNYFDTSGPNSYALNLSLASSGTCGFVVANVGGSFPVTQDLSSTAPVAFGTGDIMEASGKYEAA